jgi:hypothetical protein
MENKRLTEEETEKFLKQLQFLKVEDKSVLWIYYHLKDDYFFTDYSEKPVLDNEDYVLVK